MTVLRTGHVVATASVHTATTTNDDFAAFVAASLRRHRNGDWGTLDEHDTAANNNAANSDGRVLSAYLLPADLVARLNEARIWIITESDRAATTVLWPHEY